MCTYVILLVVLLCFLAIACYYYYTWREDVVEDTEVDDSDIFYIKDEKSEPAVVLAEPAVVSAKPQSSRITTDYGPLQIGRIDIPAEEIDATVEELISRFKNQRTEPSVFKQKSNQKQFAVLYLASSPEDITNLDDVEGTNKLQAVYPPDYQLFRFLTARPHDGNHAESLMMEKFSKLKEAYGQPVKYIVLYSWLLPCKECAAKISTTIKACFAKDTKPKLIVLYSRRRNMDDKNITKKELASDDQIKYMKSPDV